MYLETDHLNCIHALYSSKSQIQICMMIHMDDRTDKHSAKALRIDAQRTMANILIGGVEKLLLSCVFLLLSVIEE